MCEEDHEGVTFEGKPLICMARNRCSRCAAVGMSTPWPGDAAESRCVRDGTAAGVGRVTARVVRLQTGYLYHYAFAMLVGVAALLTWLTYNGLFVGGFK